MFKLETNPQGARERERENCTLGALLQFVDPSAAEGHVMPQAMQATILFASINGSLPKHCERLRLSGGWESSGTFWIAPRVLFGCKRSLNKGLEDYDLQLTLTAADSR
jgi:hypothetical protein